MKLQCRSDNPQIWQVHTVKQVKKKSFWKLFQDGSRRKSTQKPLILCLHDAYQHNMLNKEIKIHSMQFFPNSLRWFNSFKCAFYVHKRNVCMEVLINTRKNEDEICSTQMFNRDHKSEVKNDLPWMQKISQPRTSAMQRSESHLKSTWQRSEALPKVTESWEQSCKSLWISVDTFGGYCLKFKCTLL